MSRASHLLLLALALSCAPRNGVAPAAEQPVDVSAGSLPALALERTACFGGCPVYRISAWPTGEVFFEGKAHVRHLGAATGRIPPGNIEALLSEIERAGYFSFADRYAAAEPTCGRYVTDLPTVISTVTVEGRTKRIEHDYGCGAAPGALVVLERRIDEVLNSGQWTGR